MEEEEKVRRRPQGDVEDKSARDAAGIRWFRGEG